MKTDEAKRKGGRRNHDKKRPKSSSNRSRLGPRNPKPKRSPAAVTPNRPTKKKTKTKKPKKEIPNNDNCEPITRPTKKNKIGGAGESTETATAAEQLGFFLEQYQSANGIQLSPLELETINDKCILKLSQSLSQSSTNLGEHLKASFGLSWKETLCEKQLLEGKIDPGNPAVVVIGISALRVLELIKGVRILTSECHAPKLFSKHMKIDDQVSVLKGRVNVACGTPNRLKKLIDMEALGLSRLQVIVLDMYTDAKGYSIFTLLQVRDEFWDLYKTYFHPRLVQGDLRVCLYGAVPVKTEATSEVSDE